MKSVNVIKVENIELLKEFYYYDILLVTSWTGS